MRENNWFEVIATAIIGVVAVGILALFAYTQRYIDDGYLNDTATSGIWWTTTINLKQYRVIGNGSGLFGEYKLITRSMTQGSGESISVYKD